MDVIINCPCPTNHETDTVSLHDKLGLRSGSAIQSLIVDAVRSAEDHMSQADIMGLLAEAYVLYGIKSWTLTDAKDKPLALNEETIRSVLLSDYALAQPVAEAADDLYSDVVTAPLVRLASKSSVDTPTSASTSVPSTTPQPRPSKRSSTTTSPTDGTVTISRSRDGDSNSSPSLALVGA